MFGVRSNSQHSEERRVDALARASARIACALALVLGAAGTAASDTTEVAADIAALKPAEATADIAAHKPTEAAAAHFIEDAMPNGPSVADRLAIIRQKIQRALEYPPLAQLLSTDGNALIRFEIDRSGRAQDIRVARSSGNEQLDTAAVRAVEAASPLPWVYGALEVPVHFELTEAR